MRAAEHDRGRDAEQLTGDSRLERTELVRRADEHVLHGEHTTARRRGRHQRRERRPDEHTHRVGRAEHEEATNAIAKLCVTPSTMVPTPKMPTTTNSVRPTCRLIGRIASVDRHDGRADARGGAQPSEPHRADAELILGDRGEQRDRATEQHREQIERDRTEQDRRAPDEAQVLRARCGGSPAPRDPQCRCGPTAP